MMTSRLLVDVRSWSYLMLARVGLGVQMWVYGSLTLTNMTLLFGSFFIYTQYLLCFSVGQCTHQKSMYWWYFRHCYMADVGWNLCYGAKFHGSQTKQWYKIGCNVYLFLFSTKTPKHAFAVSTQYFTLHHAFKNEFSNWCSDLYDLTDACQSTLHQYPAKTHWLTYHQHLYS